MPSAFDEFLKSVVEFGVATQAAETGKKTDKYIKAQVYIYTTQVEASGHYKAAANIQVAKNAVFAGCVALCTMYVGGLIMGAIFRTAAAGTAAAEGAAGTVAVAEGAAVAETNALMQLVRASWQASGYQATTATTAATASLGVVETTAIEIFAGVPIRGLIAGIGTMITDWHNGKGHWNDIAKIGALSAGGALRCGPALGFLFGAVSSHNNQRAREEFERQVKTDSAKRLIEVTLQAYSDSVGQGLRNFGRYGQLIMAPPMELDTRVRQPMQREVDRITDQFVREQTGFFGGPERGDVYSSVYGSLGADVWAPITSDTTRAYIHLQQERARKVQAMDCAFTNWVRSF
jgi:hypothetical protein